MTISHGNLKRLACKAVSGLGLATVILTAAGPTAHARGFKKHHIHATHHIGGSPHSLLEAVLACEANPNPHSIGKVAKSIWNRLGNPRWNGSSLAGVLTMPHQYVRNCGKGGGIYAQAAAHITAYGPDSYNPAAAHAVGHMDSFHTGRSDNAFYSSGAGHFRGRRSVRYAVRGTYVAYRDLAREAPASSAATPANPGSDISNLFGIQLND